MSEVMGDEELWEALEEWIHSGDVTVEFEKKDGTKRVMRCTLRPDAYAGYEFKGGMNHDTSSLMTVWDLDKEAWRMIRYGSINSVEES